MGCHLLGFGEKLGEGPVLDGVAAHGLGEENFGRVFGAVVYDVVRDDLPCLLLGLPGCHGC